MSYYLHLQPPGDVPQTGNKIDEVPRAAFLRYKTNTLKIILGKKVLRTFFYITRLHFWTGFAGTRVFVTSAPVRDGEIHGGGMVVH